MQLESRPVMANGNLCKFDGVADLDVRQALRLLVGVCDFAGQIVELVSH